MSPHTNFVFLKEGTATENGESELVESRKRTSYKREIIFLSLKTLLRAFLSWFTVV